MQGLSRDILATKMLELEKQGYKVIMHVHDEVVLEVEESVSIEDIKRIMEEPISFLPNLKLKADTDISYYYKK